METGKPTGAPAANAAGRGKEEPPAARGADEDKEKAARRDGLGRLEKVGAGSCGRARESGPIPDGVRSSAVSEGRLMSGCVPSCVTFGWGG